MMLLKCWSQYASKFGKLSSVHLVLEKAEEPEIKLPISIGSQKKQENSKKNFCFIDYTKAFDCGKFLKRQEYQTTLPVS